MVNCLPAAVLAAFPVLKTYFVETRDVLRGVGSVRCQVLGELRRVPISLGTDQAPGSIVLCNFRVTEGTDYQIIIGMATLKPLQAVINTSKEEVEVMRGTADGARTRARLPVFQCNTVRLQPVTKRFRDFCVRQGGAKVSPGTAQPGSVLAVELDV